MAQRSIRRLKRAFRKHSFLKNMTLGVCLIIGAYGLTNALMRTDIFAGAIGIIFLILFFAIALIR